VLENFSTEILNKLNFVKNMFKEYVPLTTKDVPLNFIPMKSKEIQVLVNTIVYIYASPL